MYVQSLVAMYVHNKIMATYIGACMCCMVYVIDYGAYVHHCALMCNAKLWWSRSQIGGFRW